MVSFIILIIKVIWFKISLDSGPNNRRSLIIFKFICNTSTHHHSPSFNSFLPQGLFEFLIARYRDGYKVKDMLSPILEQEFLFYPYWWLQVSGFFKHTLKMTNPEPLRDSIPAVKEGEEAGGRKVKMPVTSLRSEQPMGGLWWHEGGKGWRTALEMVLLVVLSVAVGFWWGKTSTTRSSYTTLGI